MATFLLELLTEEIPANGLPGARRQLAEAIGQGLEDHAQLVVAGRDKGRRRQRATA
jgi:glycyl-tRNA synthetase beta subunit